MNRSAKHCYEFGYFRLDPAEHLLLREGKPVPLKPKVFDLLLELVSNSGHVLSKGELMKQVWPDTFVEEHNLAVSISTLRKALSGDQKDDHFIETVPRRGYRFVATVREVWDEGSGLSEKESGAGVKSIAVLPFRPIGDGARDDSYLGLGMADALITRISNLGQIAVRPTSAIRKYAEGDQDPVRAGQGLRVSSVLDGSIQRSGKTIRVTVQLVNVPDGETLWAEKFEEEFTNIFAVEDSISERVAGALMLTLSDRDRKRLRKRYTVKTEAYTAYLKGRFFLSRKTPSDLEKSFYYLKEAIRIDPEYALAYTGLADYYQMMVNTNTISPGEAAGQSRAAILKALELDDSLVEAHLSLAYVKQTIDWNWKAAEDEFRKAIQLNPNHPAARRSYSIFLRLMKRFDEALVEITKAMELDPLSPVVNLSFGSLLYFWRQYDVAIDQLSKTIELDPTLTTSHGYLGLTYEQLGMFDKAISTFQKVIELGGDTPEYHARLGHALAMAGKRAEAQAKFNEVKSATDVYVSPFDLALIRVGLGEKTEALELLWQGYEERCVDIPLLNVDQRFDPLRAEPRFQELMTRLGLDE